MKYPTHLYIYITILCLIKRWGFAKVSFGDFEPQFPIVELDLFNGSVFSHLQGDLVIMFSDGLRDNLHDREAVFSFFLGNDQNLM